MAIHKRFEKRRPLTTVTMTEAGHEAFDAYVVRLGALLGLGPQDGDAAAE
ncbi:winged helix DNA-binding protein [Rhodothalassium salexigens DSM 2132]|uniref:Winged helix DNA-binding protein n=1 Tax=Rhodothalassium salexigens DSM 2132 TaxID=1188247 RepID=A0A4R2PIM3_RHOSA|nr:hypothetical protein [Rhodothalassium salexigens DSM 2132]TCP35342.1 winged helix DNA-binding protein [Rhodothalassium salexigens DSM 2132]